MDSGNNSRNSAFGTGSEQERDNEGDEEPRQQPQNEPNNDFMSHTFFCKV